MLQEQLEGVESDLPCAVHHPKEFDAFDSDEECSDPIEDEHHAIFDCPAYADAREHYRDLFQSHSTTVGDFLNQPQCNRLAKFLTWIRMLRMNRA